MLTKTFGWSVGIAVAGLAVAVWYGGAAAAGITAILVILEVSLSFDNAVVNAKVLGRLSEYWQGLFLTVGMVIAVFGMRLLFPLLIVGATAHISPLKAWSLALEKGDIHTPGTYGYVLTEAHPAIAAFGGMFLLMIFLDFLIDPDKELHWIDPLERLLQRFGVLASASTIIALAALFVVTLVSDQDQKFLAPGLIGLLSYLLVAGASESFAAKAESEDDEGPGIGAAVVATGTAAFTLFVYLQVLDASFSFDGVIGAFAITADPVVIALGLGVGAFFVRSLTIFLVRKGTLSELVYLEHGAHWAIGALAVLLLVSIEHDIPEYVTGLIGVGFIAASFWSSLRVRDSVAHAV